MAKEILAIPEEKLGEVIQVIRSGLGNVDGGSYLQEISDETREQLIKWCNEEEKYLESISHDS